MLMAREFDQVAQMLSTFDAVRSEIARQRARLRSTWQVHTEAMLSVQGQLRAVESTVNSRQKALDDVVSNFGNKPNTSLGCTLPNASIDGWLQQGANGTWVVRPEIDRQF